MADNREPEDVPESEILQIAMRWLARRDYARQEMARRLESRGLMSERVASVLDQLERDNLLSDERFAEAFVRSRISRGQGPFRIRNEMRERGVSDELISIAMEEQEQDWVALAAEAKRKRFGAGRPADIRERARQTRFLNYRGFEAEQIRRALDLDDID